MRLSAPRNRSQAAISAATSGAIAMGEVISISAVLAADYEGFLHPSLSRRNRTETHMTARIVDVLVPVALDQTYSYCVPEGLVVGVGDVVTVPLGTGGETTGVVWAENDNPNPRLHNRMKDVVGKLDVPPLKPELRQFIDWVSGYTLAARGMVLRMSLRMGEHLGPGRERVGVRLSGPAPQRMTPARARA